MKMRNAWSRRIAVVATALPGLLLIACGRDEIRTYDIPKQQVQAEAPHLHWDLPAGWQEKPAEGMRAASFAVRSAAGADEADVSVIPLPGVSGTHLDNVNRWRGQVSLLPIAANQLEAETESVSIAGNQGSLVDFAGTNSTTQKSERILAATLVSEGTTWFIKMTGPPTLVGEQQEGFRKFLKSLAFHGADAHAGHGQAGGDQASIQAAQPTGLPAPPPVPGPPAVPQWEVPQGWQEQPATTMLLARFNVSDPAIGKADITVSAFPGDTGGLLANVNRWRAQIGLGTVDQSGLTNVKSEIDVNGQQAVLVDMTNETGATQANRIVAVVLPRGGQTWFFKMMGHSSLIEQQKAAFIKFVQSVRFPHA